MSSELLVGQVIALYFKYNSNGDISNKKHPYLIIDINNDKNYAEIVQLDSLQGKEHKALFKSNRVVKCTNPKETVIDKDSYVGLDTLYRVELFEELKKYRRQEDVLSQSKLDYIITEYRSYKDKFGIDETKIVYMYKEELININKP